ncbi:MAG: hypothetical protein ACREQ2_03445 [Candidatus Binatia bacterium]
MPTMSFSVFTLSTDCTVRTARNMPAILETRLQCPAVPSRELSFLSSQTRNDACRTLCKLGTKSDAKSAFLTVTNAPGSNPASIRPPIHSKLVGNTPTPRQHALLRCVGLRLRCGALTAALNACAASALALLRLERVFARFSVLRSANDLKDYAIEATDGEIGQIE